MFSQRFPRAAERQGSAPPWLRVIHAANGIEQIFGNPDTTGQREGVGYVEEYGDADVVFPDADPLTVKIVAKTELGDRVLKQAVATLMAPPKLRDMQRNPNVSSL
jgi:hypothetical protein